MYHIYMSLGAKISRPRMEPHNRIAQILAVEVGAYYKSWVL